MRDNFDDEKKYHLKIEENKRKNAKRDSLTVMKRNSSGNTRKEKRKLCVITLMMNKKNI